MPHTQQTLQNIADILSFESDKTLLKERLERETMDWDHLVRLGSSHLVLPAIYCRLKAKQLLNTLPMELESYLKEITDLNRERNQQLLAEAQQISQWFQEAGIDHVFLKGTAMLASGYYEDIGERMVGDLDILIESSRIKMALTTVKNNGYENVYDLSYQEKNHRHLDRMAKEGHIGAIELHTNLLRKNYRSLIDLEAMLNSCNLTKKISIPNPSYLKTHNILNWQINDYGFQKKKLAFRSLYDFCVLNHQFPKENFKNSKYTESYLSIGGLYFKELISFDSSLIGQKHKNSYISILRYPRLWNTYFDSIDFIKGIQNKITYFLTDPKYRTYLYQTVILKKPNINTPQN